MKLIPLGVHGPFPPSGGATSAYLLEHQDTRLLIDCGSGALSRLQAHCGLGEVDAVLLSHLHQDHCADLLLLGYAVKPLTEQGLMRRTAYPLYLPAQPEQEFARIAASPAFKVQTITDRLTIEIGPLCVTFYAVEHPFPSMAMRFEADGSALCYSGDTVLCEGILDAARCCDVFLCDAGVLERQRTPSSPHLSARQAAQVAKAAEVKRLILTHLMPLHDPYEILHEAQAVFPAAQLAVEGTEILI